MRWVAGVINYQYFRSRFFKTTVRVLRKAKINTLNDRVNVYGLAQWHCAWLITNGLSDKSSQLRTAIIFRRLFVMFFAPVREHGFSGHYSLPVSAVAQCRLLHCRLLIYTLPAWHMVQTSRLFILCCSSEGFHPSPYRANRFLGMIKVGVIGCGFSAKTFHFPLIEASDVLQLSAISSSRRAAVAAEYPTVTVFDTPQALIASGEVELVVITAPNDVHYSLAKQCLQAGVHVVVEKPMVTSCAEAEDLLRLARERSLLLSVYHNRRWDGDFLTVKSLLENKQLGELRLFESHFDRFRPVVRPRWREQPGAGSGVWFDLGSHLVDQALQLFGRPRAVTGRCLALREDSQACDYFHVLLHYPQLEVVLHASSFAAAPSPRFRVEGTLGSFVKFDLDPQEAQLKEGLTPLDANYGVEGEALYGRLYTASASEPVATADGCYQQYYQQIAAAITSGVANPVTAEEAIEVMQILELAQQSSERGQTLAVAEIER